MITNHSTDQAPIVPAEEIDRDAGRSEDCLLGEVPLIGLPLDRVARELFLLVFQCEKVLENVDLGDLPTRARSP